MAGKRRIARWSDVIDMYGDRQICQRCGASVSTYGDKCEADLDDPCQGFLVYDRMLLSAQAKIDESALQ